MITPDKKKPKYAFGPEDESLSLFWMAAIFRQAEGHIVPVFTILTMDASASVASIHNRMPVILGSKDARRAWMQGESDLKGLFNDATVKNIVYQPAA